jgi:hypothetical protein
VVCLALRFSVSAPQQTSVKRSLRFTTRVVDTSIFLLTRQVNQYKVNNMELFYANIALLLCNVTVFVMCLIARAHVVSASKALDNLDWEQTASLTGDMATVKKSIQKLNNRLNGMEAKDPYTVLESLRAQANVQPIRQQPQIKQTGG